MRHIVLFIAAAAAEAWLAIQPAYTHDVHGKKVGAAVAIAAVFLVLDLILIARKKAKARKAAPVRHVSPYAAGRR